MPKKVISALLAVILTALCFTACSKEATVLYMGVDSAAGVFDPQIASDSSAITIVRNCFEGLVRIGDGDTVLPGVAKSWTVSPDGKTYTFTLRTDAKWHLTSNAEEAAGDRLPENFDLTVTAYDFEFALRRAVDPTTACPESYMLTNIQNAAEILAGKKDVTTLGVKATDRFTLVITLSQKQSNLTDILTEPMCMPCSETFFKACTGRYGRYIKYLLSNGPYYLSRLNDDSYRINKNPDYVGEASATSDAVWLYVNSDRSSVIGNIEDKEYSCGVLTQYEYENADLSRKATVVSVENVLRAFVLNTNDSILSNENIRKALSAATDTDLAAQNAGRTPADGIVPACAADPSITSHTEAYDEDNASDYFEAGLSELGVDDVTVEIICEKDYEDMTKRLIQQWQRILGVDIGITVRTVTVDELLSAVKSGNYQIAFASVEAETDKVYEYFASFAPTSPYNTSGYSDDYIPNLLPKLYSGDDKNYSTIYHLIEKRLISASFIIPLWGESTYFVTNTDPAKVSFYTGRDKIYFR